MSITVATPVARRRPRRERWHSKFIWSKKIQFEGSMTFYQIRFETVLRRWSVTNNRWIYMPATPANILALVGTDKLVHS